MSGVSQRISVAYCTKNLVASSLLKLLVAIKSVALVNLVNQLLFIQDMAWVKEVSAKLKDINEIATNDNK